MTRQHRSFTITCSLLLLFRWLCIISSGAACSSTAPDNKNSYFCRNCKKLKSTAEMAKWKPSSGGNVQKICKECAYPACADGCGATPEKPLTIKQAAKPWYSHLSLLTSLRSSSLIPQTSYLRPGVSSEGIFYICMYSMERKIYTP